MNVTFLGTGTSQGVPVIACQCKVCRQGKEKDHRLRSSVMLESGHERVVIDAGPDFRQQMLREQVTSLNAILITHRHKDHIAGLDDVRSFNWFTRRPMDVYASAKDQQRIREEFSYAFSESAYPGVPKINLITISTEEFFVGQLKVKPLEILHMKMEIRGFKIGKFAYLTDTNYLPATVMSELLDCDTIVLNALRKEKHVSHYCLEEAIAVLEFLRPKKAYLTHLSHLMGFHEEIEKELPDFIRLAYDGLQIEIED
jgi:phosphoribosyl 1,2-cyclic phosphate phosphodiesterase